MHIEFKSDMQSFINSMLLAKITILPDLLINLLSLNQIKILIGTVLLLCKFVYSNLSNKSWS